MSIIINNTFFIGKFLNHLNSADSTNNVAKLYIAKSNPINGTVILADEQFAGRGQASNIWQSNANENLTFSIVLDTQFLLASEQFYLNMAVSLGINMALTDILDKYLKDNSVIKWPNDILVNSHKIAGILIENTIQGIYLKYSIIGIGFNVNQLFFNDNINATSLHNLCNTIFDRIEILELILQKIELYFLQLKQKSFKNLKLEYLKKLYQFGIIAHFKNLNGNIFEGKIIDVDEFGMLCIETKNGIEKFAFKEIIFLQ